MTKNILCSFQTRSKQAITPTVLEPKPPEFLEFEIMIVFSKRTRNQIEAKISFSFCAFRVNQHRSCAT
jgi:hypothetical protein